MSSLKCDQRHVREDGSAPKFAQDHTYKPLFAALFFMLSASLAHAEKIDL